MKSLGILIACSALALGACKSEKPAAPAASEGAVSSEASVTGEAPDAKPGMAVEAGRLVLPAVPGNPAAAYFRLTNHGDKPAVLAAVSIDGAQKAEMHETKGSAMSAMPTLEIKPGEMVEFAPGGKHVMAFGLGEGLKAGSTAEMTLSFSDGDKVSAPLSVQPAGSGAAMTMGHGEMH